MPRRLIDTSYPTIKVDPKLDKYQDVIRFPEKLAKANATIRKVGLPTIVDVRNMK